MSCSVGKVSSPIRFAVSFSLWKLLFGNSWFLVKKAPFKYSPVMSAFCIYSSITEILPVDTVNYRNGHNGSKRSNFMINNCESICKNGYNYNNTDETFLFTVYFDIHLNSLHVFIRFRIILKILFQRSHGHCVFYFVSVVSSNITDIRLTLIPFTSVLTCHTLFELVEASASFCCIHSERPRKQWHRPWRTLLLRYGLKWAQVFPHFCRLSPNH